VTIPRKIDFGPFHVDLDDARLWRGSEPVHLTNKAFSVLQELLGRPGQLVTREALLNRVWTRAYVTDAALAVCVEWPDAIAPYFVLELSLLYPAWYMWLSVKRGGFLRKAPDPGAPLR